MPTSKEIFNTNMNSLADAINTKAGSTGTKTIAELITAVDSITVAKEEQTKTVNLDMASGNQVISPDTNKVLSQVTVTKPATLTATNIKQGVTIGGVTGTFTSDGTATNGDLLSGKYAYSQGQLLTGTIPSKASATYNTSSSDQTIASGQYLSGNQTIKAVTTTNLVAANILSGVTVEVGDANDSDRIASVTGTAPTENSIYGEINSTSYGIVSGYDVTFTSSGAWLHSSDGRIQIYDGEENNNPLLLLDQNPANKSAFPITLNFSSGHMFMHITGVSLVGNGVTSSDYTITGGSMSLGSSIWPKADINQNGTINIDCADFTD